MATILRLDAYATANLIERTTLSADVIATDTVIAVDNGDNLTTDEYALIGNTGKELSEIRKMTVSGNDVTVTALTNAHDKTDKLTQLFGNQIKLYRASNVDGTTPADTDFTILDTVSIEPDNFYIDYTDSMGGSGYWYKQTYYNSTTTIESSIALSTASRGGGYGRYVRIDRVRSKAGLQDNPRYTDIDIDESIMEAQDEIDAGMRVAGYTVPFSSVPRFISKLTRELAVGDLLGEAYDSRAEGTNKDPLTRQEYVEKQIQLIIDRDRLLAGEDGTALVLASRFSFQPDSDVSDFIFKRDDEY